MQAQTIRMRCERDHLRQSRGKEGYRANHFCYRFSCCTEFCSHIDDLRVPGPAGNWAVDDGGPAESEDHGW